MHDEQPFCQDLTRRRTTVRFLGQQSEVTIDDTWPQAGEMRSLWKGITEFWTDDMPQDATWRPNRHHSNIIPLFRNHVTRNADGMFPPPPNLLSRLSMGAEIPVCPLCHTPRMPRRKGVLGRSELSNVYSSHHYDPSSTTESQDAAAEAADPSCQRQDTSKGMSTPPGQALVKWHGKGKYVSAVRDHHQRQSEITGTSKSVQRKLVTDEGKHHSSWTVDGRAESWIWCRTRSTKPRSCWKRPMWKSKQPRTK